MANRQFLATIDSDWNTIGNWDGGISLPSAGDNIRISANCLMDADDTNVYGTLLIDATKTFNIATFNFTCGAVTVNGTLIIGASAGTGLTCTGLTFNTGSTFTPNTAAKVNNGGNYSCANSAIFSSTDKGSYTQTASGTFNNPNSSNQFLNFTNNAGSTLTFTANGRITSAATALFTNNGTMAVSTFIMYILGGNVAIGANGDFTGSNSLYIRLPSTSTWTNNKTGTFGFTGEITIACISAAINTAIYNGDFRNATYNIIGISSGVSNFTLISNSGTAANILICKQFNITQAYNLNVIIVNTNNISIEVYEGIDFRAGAGTYTLTWTKGTGSITGRGTAGTHIWDFDTKTVEDIIINCSGATKQIGANFTTDSITITAGTLDHNGKTITVSNNYILTALGKVTGMGGTTLTVLGTYTITGSLTNIITLNPVTAWTLNVTGAGVVSYANIANSNASGGHYISALSSIDSLNNTNWFFEVKEHIEYNSGIGLTMSSNSGITQTININSGMNIEV